MKKSKLQQVPAHTVEVVVDVLCNKCGQSMKDSYSQNIEGLQASIRGGFGSKLGDEIRYSFDICEDCLGDLFKLFKCPPEES